MNEILIFVLGNIIGGLFMTIMMCIFQINKNESFDNTLTQLKKIK